MRIFLGTYLLFFSLSSIIFAKDQPQRTPASESSKSSLMTELEEHSDKTVLDYSYQIDQKSFSSSLRFQELKTGKRNKVALLKDIIQLTSNPSKEEKATKSLFLDIYDRLHKDLIKFSNDEKSALVAWDNSYGKKYGELAKSLKGYDFCQVNLNIASHVLNFSALIDSSRNYLLASFFSSNLNDIFMNRVEDVVAVLDATHECTPTIIESILNLETRLTIAELTKGLADQKKIDLKTAVKIANLIGDQSQTKKMLHESFRREFWIAFYKSIKDLTPTLLDIQKAYTAKFPNDKNPIFDEKILLENGASCFSFLIDSMLKNNSFEKEPDICQAKTIPDDKTPDIKSNKLEKWNIANQSTPMIFNAILYHFLIPKNMAAKLKYIFEDKQKLEKIVSQLQAK